MRAAPAVPPPAERTVESRSLVASRDDAQPRDVAIERMVDAVHPEFERPLGPTVAALYAMAASRHMDVYGSKPEEFAQIAVQARANALRTDGAMMRDPITVDDVLNSKPIALPLRMLDCCLFSDYAGAIVVTMLFVQVANFEIGRLPAFGRCDELANLPIFTDWW